MQAAVIIVLASTSLAMWGVFDVRPRPDRPGDSHDGGCGRTLGRGCGRSRFWSHLRASRLRVQDRRGWDDGRTAEVQVPAEDARPSPPAGLGVGRSRQW